MTTATPNLEVCMYCSFSLLHVTLVPTSALPFRQFDCKGLVRRLSSVPSVERGVDSVDR